jgi:hypothetical protein
MIIHNDTFEPLQIFPDTSGGTLVTWDLRPSFRGTAPYIFTLQWSEHNTGEYVDVDGPMTNVFFGIDDEKRTFNVEIESAYRVKLVASGLTYYSEPKTPYNNWNRHDFKIARDILRKEAAVRLDKYVGEQGWLLRRRIWGARCTECLDWDTQAVTDPKCTSCHGTGIVGGYYNAIPFTIDPTPEARKKELSDKLGEIENIVRKARVISIPPVTRDDVWVSAASDRRYYIHSVQNVAEIRGMPIVSVIEIRQAPFNDNAYSIPLSVSSESASSSSSVNS